MTDTGFYIGLGYLALFAFGSLGLSVWRIKRRNTEVGARSE
jgi:hypothetical protein